jgi:hypothetical protein
MAACSSIRTAVNRFDKELAATGIAPCISWAEAALN